MVGQMAATHMVGGGYRRLRLTLGPDPEPEEQPQMGCEGKAVGAVQYSQRSQQQETFPSVYKDLEVVFNEECEVLPPHRATNCAIELIPGAKLPKPHMYVMTQEELDELRKYIDKNLARGFIHP